MRRKMNLTIDSVTYHRNGISGASFHSVAFAWDGRKMIATVFEGEGECAVLDLGDLCECWRGDHFEPQLRKAVEAHDRKVLQGLYLRMEQGEA